MQAVERAAACTSSMSQLSDRLLVAAAEAQKSGKFETAQRFAQEALDIDPQSVPAMFLLGVASARQGDFVRAEAMLQKVLVADPNAYEALMSLSTLYRERGQLDEAIELGRRAVVARPRDAQSHNNLGLSLLAARRLEAATSSFCQAVALKPGFAAAHYNIGKTKQLEGRDGEAARAFSAAASLAPTLEYLLALGQMLLTLCDFESALHCSEQCVKQYPNSAAAHLLLCGALTETKHTVQAERHLLRAIELDPDHREALHTATRQRPLGFIEDANANLRIAIAENPRQVSAYDSLMQNQKVTESDRNLVDQMRSLLETTDLSQTELVSLHYGLGKALEDLNEYDASMCHYDEANRITRLLKFSTTPFDEDRYRRHVEQMIERNPPPNSGETAGSGLPVLIIGMMRSGTSLVEQILSSHPEVEGAGEQLFWTQNWARPEPASELCREYVEMLQRIGPNAKRVTDKMPGNYMFAGMIHRALPNARFIHIRRNPADTCLSIWATPNHQPHEGGNHKGNIAFVYEQYMQLMQFWRTVLPQDRLLEIDYEALVADPEPVIRRMLVFCGLEWDNACLRPHENKRLVATPSAWQVRQPLYKSSVARWKHFEPWLGDFRQLLDVNHPSVHVNT